MDITAIDIGKYICGKYSEAINDSGHSVNAALCACFPQTLFKMLIGLSVLLSAFTVHSV